MNLGSTKKLWFAAIAGGVISIGVNYLIMGDSDQTQKIISMEDKIKNLQLLLSQKEKELERENFFSSYQNNNANVASNKKVAESCKKIKESDSEQNDNEPAVGSTSLSDVQMLRNVMTSSDNDPRSVAEKISDLASIEPNREKIAIASKAVFDMAKNRTSLPDYALQSMYSNQTDPDLKRVIAQVLSERGNNALINDQVAEAQTHLQSQNPTDRQAALNNLAKMHNANAANAIAPLLHDSDVNVKLDALLALRATGNQTHVGLAEALLNDPDPAVSSLAGDVVTSLKNLSDSARTNLSNADIEAELPIINNQ